MPFTAFIFIWNLLLRVDVAFTELDIVFFLGCTEFFFFYPAITMGVKTMGPVIGFILGSFCTSIYVEPFVEPDVSPIDPRWIGAWWLGAYPIPPHP